MSRIFPSLDETVPEEISDSLIAYKKLRYSWSDTAMYVTKDSDDGTNEFARNKNVSRISSRTCYYYSHMIDWSNTRVIKIAIIHGFLILTDDGKVYYKGLSNNNLERIKQINIKGRVTCIACGCNFYTVVTDKGKIYSWGLNHSAQLGIPAEVSSTNVYETEPQEVVELSDKTIVKITCGNNHTLALTDEGKVYGWGANNSQQLIQNGDDSLSPVVVNISNVRKVSDIATLGNLSVVKCSNDGLIYMRGSFCNAGLAIKEFAVCEYTNIFDFCNTLMAQSPISMGDVYTDEEFSILNDLEAAFNDCSTSDLTIEVEEQSIYVHKAILKIRSTYFGNMFQFNWTENDQSVIKFHHYSYVVYKAFLKYLYTGVINLSLENKLDLLKLADEYCEKNLERNCIWMIKEEITASNVFYINNIAIQYNKKELEEYCFKFYMKNNAEMMQNESFTQLDAATKISFITKENEFFKLCF